MSEITMQHGGTVRRDPERILQDIERHKQRAAESLVLIGLDLIEAKAQLQHGQWADFLARAGFSARTASNYMRVAGAMRDAPQLANLPYSKALALIEAPEDAREKLLDEGVEDKSAAEIRRLTKELADARELAAAQERNARQQLEKRKEYAQQVNILSDQLDELHKRKPETITVEVAPPDYEDLKASVETLRAQLADAEAAVEEAENRAAGAIAADAGADPDHDRLSAVEFVGACTEFMGHVEFYPYHKTELHALDDVSRRRMEIFARGVQNWAVRMLGALAEAGGAVDCEGAVSGV